MDHTRRPKRGASGCVRRSRSDATAALPPPRRRARRLPRDRDRPGARAPALAGPLAPRVGADRRALAASASASCSPTCRCTATPRTARGTPTARMAHRGDRGLLPGGRRPALDGRRPRRRRRARAAGGQRAVSSSPPRLVLMPNRLHRRDEFAGQARGLASRLPGGGAARPRPGARARSQARVPAGDGREAVRAGQPRPRATSSATRSPTSAATATAPARGPSSPAAGRSRRSASCSTRTRA